MKNTRLKVALIVVYSHDQCTLKDVAGGYGTVFKIGDSWRARVLEYAKSRIIHLPSVQMGILYALAQKAGHDVSVAEICWTEHRKDPLPRADLAIVLTSIVDTKAEREVLAALNNQGVHTFAWGALAHHAPQQYADLAHAVIQGEPEALGTALFDPTLSGVVNAGFVADLDTLPNPQWDGFPRATYAYAFLAPQGFVLPVAGSRGCAYGCGYCPFRVTAPFRQRDPHAVAAEVAQLIKKYQVRGIAFRDPLFNFDRERTLELAKSLEPLRIRFSAEMRADCLDEELLTNLSRAGLKSLEIGVESTDIEMLKNEQRHPPTLAQIHDVVQWSRKLGIRVVANFMFGLLDDTEQKIRETVAFAKQLNTFAVQFTVATPYPGTRLEQATQRKHQLPGVLLTGWNSSFAHPNLSAEKLHALREWAYVSYHFRPHYWVEFAKNLWRTSLSQRNYV